MLTLADLYILPALSAVALLASDYIFDFFVVIAEKAGLIGDENETEVI